MDFEFTNEIDFLICTICHEQFKDPFSLPCLHSYCKGCLEIYTTRKTKKNFECPICRLEFKFGSWKKDFRCEEFIAYVKNNSNKKSKKFKSCDSCEKNLDKIEVQLCKECSEIFCLDCSLYHKKNKNTRDHTVYALDPESNPLCSLHDKKLEIFCKECTDAICVVCALVNHQGHPMCPIEEQAIYLKKKIGKLLAHNNAKLSQIYHNILQDKETKMRLEKNFDTMLLTVTQRRDEAIQKLNRFHKECTKEIEEKKQESLKRIQQNIDINASSQEVLTGLRKCTPCFLNEKSIFTICKLYKSIEASSNAAQHLPLDMGIYEGMYLKTKSIGEFNLYLREYLGTIDYINPDCLLSRIHNK